MLFNMDAAQVAQQFGPVVHVRPAGPDADVLVVCEHASNRFPAREALELSPELRESHIAWDPGALGVAVGLAARLEAPLVHGGVSRLLYDCNRPPEAHDAIPERSETYDIPGNASLSEIARRRRVEHIYFPFRDRLASEIETRREALALLVTVHSFTPIFHGRKREVELGILHGTDARFAIEMAATRPTGCELDTRINEPYGPEDGVTHTLDLHGTPNGLLNVMLEIRNDLIDTADRQQDMAELLAPWLETTLARLLERGNA
jgi:predicted N-formylglutamate amidohydrolase